MIGWTYMIPLCTPTILEKKVSRGRPDEPAARDKPHDKSSTHNSSPSREKPTVTRFKFERKVSAFASSLFSYQAVQSHALSQLYDARVPIRTVCVCVCMWLRWSADWVRFLVVLPDNKDPCSPNTKRRTPTGTHTQGKPVPCFFYVTFDSRLFVYLDIQLNRRSDSPPLPTLSPSLLSLVPRLEKERRDSFVLTVGQRARAIVNGTLWMRSQDMGTHVLS